MKNYYLAQVNVAKMLAPMHDPMMQDFVNNEARINAIAYQHEGFIWQLEEKDLAIDVFKDKSLIINISVWKSIETLFDYTYRSGHAEIFKRKKEWFSKMKLMHMAFWYIPEGYKPTLQDAKNRLDYLNKYGDTPYAFGFKSKFSKTDALHYTPNI